MEWNDLPKQKKLLIFMLNREASTEIPFTIAGCGNDVVANGISANKNALANMLYTLCQKKQIEKVRFQNGTFGYLLTDDGECEAEYWLARCDDDVEVPESTGSLQETEEPCCDTAAYAKRLEQIVVGLKDELFKLNGQPKHLDGLVKAQAKEIERLKTQIKRLETENDSLRVSKKIVRDAALYFDEEKTALRNERDNLKRSLSSALADLDRKNKKIDHLEDSIDKLKVNLAKMAEWAGQLKNGAN